jgi:hypothetical protein
VAESFMENRRQSIGDDGHADDCCFAVLGRH